MIMTKQEVDNGVTFKHVEIYRVSGINLESGTKEVPLISTPKNGLTAVLKSSPEFPTTDFDSKNVTAYLLLTSKISVKSPPEENLLHIAEEVEKVKIERSKKYANGTFLIITQEGNLPQLDHKSERDYGSFIVGVDSQVRSSNLDHFNDLVDAFLISLAIEVPRLVGWEKVVGSTVFFDKNEKPIYSYSLTMGEVSCFASSPITEEEILRTTKRFDGLLVSSNLDRVQRLLLDSYHVKGDSSRSFISAWNAFEVFVNKTFKSTYESVFFNNLKLEDLEFNLSLSNLQKSAHRYSILEKFDVIGGVLDPKSVANDSPQVKIAKDVRDDFFHGQEVDTSNLPIEPIQSLTRKYLGLHYQRLSDLQRKRLIAGTVRDRR